MRRGCSRGELVVPAPGGGELSPREAELGAAAELLVADEGVEQVELVRGSREPTLLELPRHRDQALARGCEVLTRSASAPRVGAGAAVAEDTARENEPLLVFRPQLRERRVQLVEEPRRRVELGLDVGFAALRPDERRVAAVAE